MYIHPIETYYAGHKFRSRLEARWAVFFDTMNVEWVYEPDGFMLSNGIQYLPDFYLPRMDWYAEVKIDRPRSNLEMKIKVEQMVLDTHSTVLVLENVPPPPRDGMLWDYPVIYFDAFDIQNPVHMRRVAIKNSFEGAFLFDVSEESIRLELDNTQTNMSDEHINYKLLEEAYNNARRARFGTGDSEN